MSFVTYSAAHICTRVYVILPCDFELYQCCFRGEYGGWDWVGKCYLCSGYCLSRRHVCCSEVLAPGIRFGFRIFLIRQYTL